MLKAYLCIALFWALLFAFDFPAPITDDIAFLGPALNLAANGSFSNPYCPSFDLIGGKGNFFIYMPLQGHVLAIWLSLFGVGRTSLAAFQCCSGMLGSVTLFSFLAPKKRLLFFASAASVSVAVYLSALGFRPDALGLAFFGGGLLLLRAESLWGWAFSSLSLFLSGITSPAFAPLSLIIAGFALFWSWKGNGIYDRRQLYRAGILLLSGLAACFLFLVLIDFKVSAFFLVFNKAREGATFLITFTNSFSNLRNTCKLVVQLVLPFIGIIGLVLCLKLRPDWLYRRPVRSEMICFCLFTLFILFDVFSSGSGLYLANLYCVLMVLLFAAHTHALDAWKLRLLWFCSFVIFFFNHGRLLAQILVAPFFPVPDISQQISAQLQDLKPASIYIDSAAAYRFYHYRLPSNVFDFNFGVAGHWGTSHRREDFPAHSVLLVSNQTAVNFNLGNPVLVEAPFHPMPLLGWLYPKTAPNPYELVLIPLDEAKTSQAR